MKDHNEKIKRSPVTVDTNAYGSSSQHAGYSFVSQEDINQATAKLPEPLNTAMADVYIHLNHYFKDKEREENHLRELGNKDHEHLRLALVAEMDKRFLENHKYIHEQISDLKKWLIGTVLTSSALIVTIFAASSGFLAQVFGG